MYLRVCTLLENVWQILLYVTYDAIAKVYVKFRQIVGNI